MKKTLITLFVAGAVGITAVGIFADEHEEREGGHEAREREHYGQRDHEERHEREGYAGGGVAAYLSDPRYSIYKTECGGCHLAFPPSMLPAASWQGMMGTLSEHFGDNAELDKATADQITAFLDENAAGEARGEYALRSWRATRGLAPPMRITETDYFLGQHHEIPAKMVAGNPDVVSFSRCETCHRGADQGDFNEDGVRIPGYDRWDD